MCKILWHPQIACFPSVVKNNVFVAKIWKYALYESLEGFCCAPRKSANPCYPNLILVANATFKISKFHFQILLLLHQKGRLPWVSDVTFLIGSGGHSWQPVSDVTIFDILGLEVHSWKRMISVYKHEKPNLSRERRKWKVSRNRRKQKVSRNRR